MARMTNKDLVDENIRLREHANQLESKLASVTSELNAQIETKRAAGALAEYASPSLELVAYLQSRGMPRMFQFGREVIPSMKQVEYWSQRVGSTH